MITTLRAVATGVRELKTWLTLANIEHIFCTHRNFYQVQKQPTTIYLHIFFIFQEAEGRKSEPSMKRKHVTLSSDGESDSDIRHHKKEKGKKVKYNEKPISEAYWGFK